MRSAPAGERLRRGLAAFHAGRIASARREIAAACRDPSLAPWACQQLIQTYVQRGEVGRAGEALARLGDRLGLGYALQLRAKALYRLADYSGAAAMLHRALEVHERAGHGVEVASVLNNLGLWHLDLSSPAAAAERFGAARQWFRR